MVLFYSYVKLPEGKCRYECSAKCCKVLPWSKWQPGVGTRWPCPDAPLCLLILFKATATATSATTSNAVSEVKGTHYETILTLPTWPFKRAEHDNRVTGTKHPCLGSGCTMFHGGFGSVGWSQFCRACGRSDSCGYFKIFLQELLVGGFKMFQTFFDHFWP
jgi:hypothetical protein